MLQNILYLLLNLRINTPLKFSLRQIKYRRKTMTKERKQEIIETYKREEKDTGSPEVQIALLTERINELTEHLKVHKKIIIQDVDYLKWLEQEETY